VAESVAASKKREDYDSDERAITPESMLDTTLMSLAAAYKASPIEARAAGHTAALLETLTTLLGAGAVSSVRHGALKALHTVAKSLPWRGGDAGVEAVLDALVVCAAPEANIPAVRKEAARLLIEWSPRVEGGMPLGLAGRVKAVLAKYQEENLMPRSQYSQLCADGDGAAK